MMAEIFVQDPVLNEMDDDGAYTATALYRLRAFRACIDGFNLQMECLRSWIIPTRR